MHPMKVKDVAYGLMELYRHDGEVTVEVEEAKGNASSPVLAVTMLNKEADTALVELLEDAGWRRVWRRSADGVIPERWETSVDRVDWTVNPPRIDEEVHLMNPIQRTT